MNRRRQARWVVRERAPLEFLRADGALHPLLLQALHARGVTNIEDARGFLAASPDVKTGELTGLAEARNRIRWAIEHRERVAIYGDYDCDGVTACALMHETLTALGANFEIYIPDRFDEGYGLNTRALDVLKERGCALVITVDCGARAVREAEHAREIGLDLVVTDHHELEGGALPAAVAVVNPHRPDCAYSYKSLAGVGVAFRLAEALLDGHKTAMLSTADLLDLVAIGTVADVMPLTGENRVLVQRGLERINTSPRPGVAALLRQARIATGACSARDLAFALGPRLNAAGRVENARSALELLITQNTEWAAALAGQLEESNNKRQWLTNETVREAEQKLPPVEHPRSLVFVAGAGFNAGVIGLAAARLMERHTAPAVVATIEGELARASCRSVDGFHITKALDDCAGLLLKHGGHAAAAGFTTRVEWLPELSAALGKIANEHMPPEGWERVIRADAEVQLHKLERTSWNALQQLEPHGHGNPKPIWVVRGAQVQRVGRVGKGAEGEAAPHLKLSIKDAKGQAWDAIGWRMADASSDLNAGDRVDLAFQLDVNEWNGQNRLQLLLLDWAKTPVSPPISD